MNHLVAGHNILIWQCFYIFFNRHFYPDNRLAVADYSERRVRNSEK